MKNDIIEELNSRKNGMFNKDVTPNEVVDTISQLPISERSAAMIHAMLMRNAVLNEAISIIEGMWPDRMMGTTKDEVEKVVSHTPEQQAIIEKFAEAVVEDADLGALVGVMRDMIEIRLSETSWEEVEDEILESAYSDILERGEE